MPLSYYRGPRVSAGLVDPHVPFDKAAHLPLRIAAREHPLDEFVMLGLSLGVLLRLERDDREQILDLGEHPLLDDIPDLLVGGPRGILAVVLRAVAKRELHHFVAEVLRVGDARGLLDLREFR